MYPATHYVGPCCEFEISGVTAQKDKKNPATPNTQLIFYTPKGLVFAEREKKKVRGRKYCGFTDSFVFAPNIS